MLAEEMERGSRDQWVIEVNDVRLIHEVHAES